MHTDIPTHSEVEQLLNVRGPGCVSIYVPTTPVTPDAQGDRIELKNLAAQASERAAANVMEPVHELVDDEDFWAEQARTLALFASPAGLRTFRLPNRLTAAVEVSDRFYVKPLLRATTFPQAAFVLALATGSVRLVEVAGDEPPDTVSVPGLPTDAASAAGKASIADRAPSRRVQGSEGQKLRMRQFARKVDHALRGVLAGLELPLILAAAEPLDAIYRSVNSYPHLAVESIAENPGRSSDVELAAAAREILDQIYAGELAELRELFEARAAQDRASTDLARIGRAATFGAVDTLFADIDEPMPGQVDEETGAVTLADGDAGSYGVIDEIARRVWLSGGRVLAVRRSDVPGGEPLAAILRYAI